MHVNMHCRAADGRFPRVFKALTKTQLLILDDWGPDRLNASQRCDLMEIVEDRYGNGSTLITHSQTLSSTASCTTHIASSCKVSPSESRRPNQVTKPKQTDS